MNSWSIDFACNILYHNILWAYRPTYCRLRYHNVKLHILQLDSPDILRNIEYPLIQINNLVPIHSHHQDRNTF